MAQVSKSMKKIRQMIVQGHRAGVCDSDGNSIDSFDGTPTARPLNVTGIRIRFSNGYKEVYGPNGWARCES